MASPAYDPAVVSSPECHVWTDRVPGLGRIVVGHGIDAVCVRAGLGAEISFHLSRNGFSGPVLRHPARPFTKWIFLTTSHPELRRSTVVDLLCSNAGFLRHDTAVVLPPFHCAHGEVQWVMTPTENTELFPWQAVLTALRATSGGSW